MEGVGIGAGLGAIAFWGFVAACVVAGAWRSIRKRETEHETLRRLIESGQTIDQQQMKTLLGGDNGLDRHLKAAGLVVLIATPGLALLGWLLGSVAAWAPFALLGVAALAGFIGLGLLVASKALGPSDRDASMPKGPMA